MEEVIYCFSIFFDYDPVNSGLSGLSKLSYLLGSLYCTEPLYIRSLVNRPCELVIAVSQNRVALYCWGHVYNVATLYGQCFVA